MGCIRDSNDTVNVQNGTIKNALRSLMTGFVVFFVVAFSHNISTSAATPISSVVTVFIRHIWHWAGLSSIWAIGARDLQFSETSVLILRHQKLSTVFLIYISCNTHSWWHCVGFVAMFTVWPMWDDPFY